MFKTAIKGAISGAPKSAMLGKVVHIKGNLHAPLPRRIPGKTLAPPPRAPGLFARSGNMAANWVKQPRNMAKMAGGGIAGAGIAAMVTRTGNATSASGYGQSRGMYMY